MQSAMYRLNDTDDASKRDVRKITLEQALDENPVSFFQYRILMICGLAFMADALEINLLYFLSVCAGDEFNLSDAEKAGLDGSVFFGILVGALFWGYFATIYGRYATFLLSTSIIGFSGFMSGLAPNYGWLIFLRTTVGFGVGGASVPFDLLAEFTPASSRGRFLVCIEYFWVLGSLFVTGLAWVFLESAGWRVLCYLTAIPIAFVCAVGVVVLPESPAWLMMKGKMDEAVRVIRDSAAVNGVIMEPFTLIAEEEGGGGGNYLDLVRDRKTRNITLPLLTVWIMFGFTYYGFVLLVARIYSSDTDDDGGEDDDNETCGGFDYMGIFVNATAEALGVTLAAIVIDWPSMGRKRTQAVTYTLSAVTTMIVGLMAQGSVSKDAIIVIAYIGRASIMAASITTWLITPELYPTETRTMAHAVCSSLSKIGAFLVSFLIFSDLSNTTVSLFLCFMNMVAVGATFLLPETLGTAMGHSGPVKDKSLAKNEGLGGGQTEREETWNILHGCDYIIDVKVPSTLP